jgi:hypothetical protein
MIKVKRFRFSDLFWKKIASMVDNSECKVAGRGMGILKRGNGDVELIELVNIVTDQGDRYYAEMAMGQTPTVNFKAAGSGLRLGTGTGTPHKDHTDVTTFLAGSAHAIKSGYPKTNDNDGDNTGAGVDIASWIYEYLTSEGNGADIAEGAIADDRTTPTALVSHFLFAAPFTKTSADTLKVIINHQFNGV